MQRLMTLLLIAATSLTANAQQTLSTKIPVDIGPTKGLRISYLKPIMKIGGAVEERGTSRGFSYDIDSVDGVAAGYAHLPLHKIGYTYNFGLLRMERNGDTEHIIRADGNFVHMFNSRFGLRGGVNASGFLDNDSRKMLKPGIGFQAAMTFQFTPMFGADFGYTRMNQSSNSGGLSKKMNVNEQGLEVALTGTF